MNMVGKRTKNGEERSHPQCVFKGIFKHRGSLPFVNRLFIFFIRTDEPLPDPDKVFVHEASKIKEEGK